MLIHIRAIFVATPPQFRGGLQSSNDIDVQIDKLFPDAHLFFEKPVATSPDAAKSIEEAKAVGEILKKHKGHVSIGYAASSLTSGQRDTWADLADMSCGTWLLSR